MPFSFPSIVEIKDFISELSPRRRVLIGGSFLAISQNVIRMATALITVPLTLGYLGKERYGLWMVTLSTLAFVSFFDVGLMPTLKNRMAEAYGKQDIDVFRFYSSGGINIGIGILLIGLIALPFLPLFDWTTIFKVTDPVARRETLPLVLIVYVVGLVTLACSGIDNIYMARMQVTTIQVYGICVSLGGFLLLLLGIKLKVGLPTLTLLTSCPVIVYRLILGFTLYKTDRTIIVSDPFKFLPVLKEIIPLSVAFWGMNFAVLVLSMLPNLIITKAINLSHVATFGVASRLATIPLTLISSILPIFWPAFTIAWSRGEKSWLRRRIQTIVTVTIILLVLYTFLISVIGPSIIRWWTLNIIYVSYDVLLVLGLLTVVQATVYWLSTFLHSISDFRYEFFCYSGSAVILIGFGLILTRHFGIFGLALILTLSWFIGCLVPMACRVIRKLSS